MKFIKEQTCWQGLPRPSSSHGACPIGDTALGAQGAASGTDQNSAQHWSSLRCRSDPPGHGGLRPPAVPMSTLTIMVPLPHCLLLWLSSHSVVSDSLWPHGLQHTRFLCPSPSPGVCSNSCPLSRWCHSTISSSVVPFLLPSIFPSIRVLSNESVLHIRWLKYWSVSFSISPSNIYSGLISFRIDWFDLLAVQGTLKSLLQPHSSKASILQCSAFFMIQLSHAYITTGKTIAFTRRTFVGKMLSLWRTFCVPSAMGHFLCLVTSELHSLSKYWVLAVVLFKYYVKCNLKFSPFSFIKLKFS